MYNSSAYAMSALSSLKSRFNSGPPGTYRISAGEAYVCTDKIICPWPGKNLSDEKECFNYWKSSARIFIEQEFNMLVARWGIF